MTSSYFMCTGANIMDLEINYIDNDVVGSGGAGIKIGYASSGSNTDNVPKGNYRSKVNVGPVDGGSEPTECCEALLYSFT